MKNNKNYEVKLSILDLIKDSYGSKDNEILNGAKIMLATLKKETKISNSYISEYINSLENIIRDYEKRKENDGKK